MIINSPQASSISLSNLVRWAGLLTNATGEGSTAGSTLGGSFSGVELSLSDGQIRRGWGASFVDSLRDRKEKRCTLGFGSWGRGSSILDNDCGSQCLIRFEGQYGKIEAVPFMKTFPVGIPVGAATGAAVFEIHLIPVLQMKEY